MAQMQRASTVGRLRRMPAQPAAAGTGTAARRADGSSAVVMRRAAFCLACILGLVASLSATDAPDAIAVLPFLFAAIVLQFLPLFWPAEVDPFAPAAVPALMFGPDLIANVIQIVRTETVEISYLPGLPSLTRVELVQKAVFLWILASLAYYAGYYWGAGRTRIATIFPSVTGITWHRTRMILACGVCFAAFLGAYAFFQNRVGVPLTDMTSLEAGKAVWRDDPSMSWLGRGVLLGCIPLLFWVSTITAGSRLRRIVPIGAACLIMALLATRLGQRGHGLFFLLTCLIILHNVFKRLRISLLAVLAFAAVVSLDVMLDWRRQDDDPSERNPLVARIMSPEQTLASYATDRNRIPIMATVMYYIPERQDYLMGESYLALLTAPIPKWVWPEKDTILRWRDTSIMPTLHSIPGPLQIHGVLYANFSWIGTAMGMFLWGLFQRGLYEWLIQARSDKNRALLYPTMLLYISPSTIAIAMALQYVLPIWLILKFVGKKPAGARASSTTSTHEKMVPQARLAT